MDNSITSLLTPKDIARFWSKVDKSEGYGPWGDCWKWTGGLNNKQGGYGRVSIRRGKKQYPLAAHKIAYVLAGNVIPEGLSVLHSCDIRNCVNPAHLSTGSRAANTADMLIKGRHKSRTLYEGKGLAVAVKLRLAELATARGLSLTRLKEISGLPPGAVQHLWYNRVDTINLAALTRLTEILKVEPGELFAKVA